MPPARKTGRSSSGPASRGSQKTLPFNNNTRISKPHAVINAKDSSLLKSAITSSLEPSKEDNANLAPALAQPITKGTRQKAEVKKEQSEEEVRARKVSDAQIKRYWKEKENERIASRVHQEDLSTEEKILRLFDMSSSYGVRFFFSITSVLHIADGNKKPCIGITRSRRWTRAHKLRLNPPIEVLAVLLKEEGRGNNVIERAHVDELMSSKMIEAWILLSLSFLMKRNNISENRTPRRKRRCLTPKRVLSWGMQAVGRTDQLEEWLYDSFVFKIIRLNMVLWSTWSWWEIWGDQATMFTKYKTLSSHQDSRKWASRIPSNHIHQCLISAGKHWGNETWEMLSVNLNRSLGPCNEDVQSVSASSWTRSYMQWHI